VDVDCEGNSDLCHSGRWQLRQLSDVRRNPVRMTTYTSRRRWGVSCQSSSAC